MENIHRDGHAHNSTGQGIHPIRGIKNAKFEVFHGLISGCIKLFEMSIVKLPFINREITAKNVKNVSKVTRNLEILSSALYFPINKINPQTTNTKIDKSMDGKLENTGIFVNKTPVTKLTAAIVKVPVIKLTTKNIGK